jgi:hypothetical protein
MDRGRIGKERGGEETDGCPLTMIISWESGSSMTTSTLTTSYHFSGSQRGGVLQRVDSVAAFFDCIDCTS